MWRIILYQRGSPIGFVSGRNVDSALGFDFLLVILYSNILLSLLVPPKNVISNFY